MRCLTEWRKEVLGVRTHREEYFIPDTVQNFQCVEIMKRKILFGSSVTVFKGPTDTAAPHCLDPGAHCNHGKVQFP